MRVASVFFIIIIASSSLLSCGGGSAGNSQPAYDSDQQSAAIAFQVNWPGDPAASTINRSRVVEAAVDCGALNVDKITAQVFSDTHDLLQTGGPWDCSDGGGTISNVPVRDNLLVRLCAVDNNGEEVYRGQASNVSVQASKTANVSISMENVINRTVSMVQDIYPGSGSSFPHRLFELQSQLCFVALDIDSGFEPFITGADGNGAQLLRDIYPNDNLDRTGAMAPTDFVELNGWLYFCANNGGGYHLWRTNGTSASTELVAGSTNFFNPTELTVLGDLLFFSAESDAFGRELWVFDESSGQAQARQVGDIYPGQAGSNPHDLIASGDGLFFAADDGQNGCEIWQTDAAATACNLVTDIYSGAGGSYPRDLTDVNGRLIFIANDSGSAGKQLWMLWSQDSTLNVEMIASSTDSGIRSLTLLNGTTVGFSANLSSAAGQELYLFDWQTDSAPRRITDLNPGNASSYPANFVYLDGMLYFTASNRNSVEHLWAYSLGQQTLTCLTVDLEYPSPRDITVVNQNLYFSASDEAFGRSLWATDGIRAGLVVATNGGNIQHSPSNLMAASNGRLYYSAFDDEYGEELFMLDDR
jgi:ELWxxDGT repeat protein